MKAIAAFMVAACLLAVVVVGFGTNEPYMVVPLVLLTGYWFHQYRVQRRRW